MKSNWSFDEMYIERTDINEFLREHKVMAAVYDVVRRLCDPQDIAEVEVIALLNYAFKICTIATSQEGTVVDVKKLGFSYDNPEFDNIAYSTALCLLKLHQGGVVYVSEEIASFLRDHGRKNGMNNYFQTIIRNYAQDFEGSINFSGKALCKPVETTDEPDPAERFKRVQEDFATAANLLIEQNETLQKQLKEMEEKYETERRLRHKSDALHQRQSDMYLHKIKELEACIQQMGRRERLKKTVEIPEESRVFSPRSFSDYALSLPSDEEARFIVNLLRDLCWRNRFMDSEVMTIIDSIMPQRQEAEEKRKARQQEALRKEADQQATAGPTNYTYNIHQVGQLNPAASEVHNQYERPDNPNECSSFNVLLKNLLVNERKERGGFLYGDISEE